MPRAQLISANESTAITTVHYRPLANGTHEPRTTEAAAQVVYRTPGTFLKFMDRVYANATTAASTIRLRKNGVNGNISVSVGAGATGTFEDTTGTDTIVAGDKVNISSTPGSAHALTEIHHAILFEATTNTVARYCNRGGGFTIDSTTYYGALVGEQTNPPEVDTQQEALSGTLKHLAVNVTANGRTTTTTFATRINGVTSGPSVSFGSGVTGIIEDSTTTATLAETNLVNYAITTSTGGGTITSTGISVSIETTTKKSRMMAGRFFLVDATLLRYVEMSCDIVVGTNDDLGPTIAPYFPVTMSKFGVRIATNTLNGTTIPKVMKDGVATILALTITAGATGNFEDPDTVNFTSTEKAMYFVDPGTSTTGAITFIALATTYEDTTVEAGAIVFNLQLG